MVRDSGLCALDTLYISKYITLVIYLPWLRPKNALRFGLKQYR